MLNLSNLARMKGFRFPRSVIGNPVWTYHRFALSFRDVDLLAERGITVSYETIRDWVGRFGLQFAAKIRRGRPAPADKWHLDEVVVRIEGRTHWLRRAVDTNGDVLDILVQSSRDKAAALRFLRRLFKRRGRPRVMVTDKLRSYGAAKAEITPGLEHRQHKGLNNRGEPPTDTREGARNYGPVQIPVPGTALFIRARPDCQHLPPKTPPPLRHLIPSCQGRCILSLG